MPSLPRPEPSPGPCPPCWSPGNPHCPLRPPCPAASWLCATRRMEGWIRHRCLAAKSSRGSPRPPLTRFVSCVSIMKLCTCFSALVSSSFLATTATTSAVQPAPYGQRTGLVSQQAGAPGPQPCACIHSWSPSYPSHGNQLPVSTKPPPHDPPGTGLTSPVPAAVWQGSCHCSLKALLPVVGC